MEHPKSHDDFPDSSVTVPPHPLRIKPAGNAYTEATNIKIATGFFSVLPDELIIQVLEFLDAPQLLSVGATCKALYAFCQLEELWKALFIRYGCWLHSIALYSITSDSDIKAMIIQQFSPSEC